MCLIAFAIGGHRRWRFALAANRDEFHARPTAAAAALDAAGSRYGGRDLAAGGGWLQVDARGRVAAVTNVRLGRAEAAARSRGELVAAFIAGDARPAAFAAAWRAEPAKFGAFNLLLWDAREAVVRHVSNHPAPRERAVAGGVHAVSNADLDTPWPKTLALRTRLAAWLASPDAKPDPRQGEPNAAALFEALADRREAVDADLPATGVPLAWERRLSAAFIAGEDYGTRASTVVLAADDGMWFEERRFGPGGAPSGRSAVWLPRRR